MKVLFVNTPNIDGIKTSIGLNKNYCAVFWGYLAFIIIYDKVNECELIGTEEKELHYIIQPTKFF